MSKAVQTAWSVRTFLYAGLGGLGLLLLAAAGNDTVQAIQRLRVASNAITVVEAAQDAFAALQAERSERGPLQIALLDKTPATDAQMARFIPYAAALDSAIDHLLSTCTRLACGADSIGAARADVTRTRQSAHAALRQPFEARPADVAKVWYSTASTLVDRLEAVVATLTGSVRRASHDGAIMAAVKDAAYAARDAAGLKRTLIAAIMREGRISPENRRQMAELHSVIALSSRLARAAIGEHPVPVLAAAQAAAQEAYFDRYVALRDRVEAAVDASQAPPVSIGEIDRAADVALRPLMALAEVPLAVAAASESADAAAARRDVAATGGMVVLALLCVIFIMITMRHRVLRPLGLLVEALRRVARRDYDFVLPIGSRAAEVAAMAAAIEACRDGLREADASAAAEAEA